MPSKSQLAALLLALAPLAAFSQQIEDPANLMGERVSPPALADTLPINHGAPALEQLLRKLRTRASMMLIVAHPDDEDSGLLTLESRGMGARVAMLTLTRGEGGQNLMTGDFNDALGLIRTQELLGEDRYTGTDQFFGTEVDFGFSKTKEEAFKQWTHERVLYDAVRAVRLYRPLVLASVFIGGVTDGHGQHQVSGEISQEVFLAAADPKVFPEMGLPPWAPLRVYARVPFAQITDKGMFDYATGKFMPPHFHNYVTGVDTTTAPEATVTIHEGEVPKIPSFHGMSFVQWARQGLALQKTQIGANFRVPPAGRVDVGYTLYGSRDSGEGRDPANSGLGGEDLFTGIDTSLPGLISLAPRAAASVRVVLKVNLVRLDASLAEAQRAYDPTHLERLAPTLRAALASYDQFLKNVEGMGPAVLPPDEKFNLLHELRIKRVQLNDALVLALGVQFRASTPLPVFISNRPSVEVVTHLSTQAGEQANCRIVSVGPTLTDGEKLTACSRDGEPPAIASRDIAGLIGGHLRTRPVTRPYFYRTSMEQPFYMLLDPALRNAPAAPPQVVRTRFDSEGVPLDLAAVVESGAGPEPAGSSPHPVVVIPPVNVSISPTLSIVTPADTTVNVVASIHAIPSAYGAFRFPVPAGWRIEPHVERWSLDHPAPSTTSQSDTARIPFTLTVPLDRPTLPRNSSLTASSGFEKETYNESFRPVGYPGLPATNYYTPATLRVVPVDVTTAPQLRIAYLAGTGDEVAEFLPSLGVKPTVLSTKDLTAENLKRYDAVVLGVRAYSAHPELEGAGSAELNEYAKQGGVVIVQYSSGGFDAASAPYPYTVPGDSAHNVVDEDQPVRLLVPDNPLLTWPNKITAADFDKWIEERGHGFASEWASEYTPLLETHDPEQDPQKGGLLVAKVGKGAYIYCAFALYRQLPEGVPGAYRLMANLLSYAKNPGR